MTLKEILLALGGLAIVVLVPMVVSRARTLNRRIEEHFAEEERPVKDPYAQLAELLNAEQTARKKDEGSN